MITQEPTYTDVDDDGMPYKSKSKNSIPKWRIPSTPLQKEFLSIFGLSVFPHGKSKTSVDSEGIEKRVVRMSSKDIREALVIIEKGMSPMTAYRSANIPPKTFPKEWVEWCFAFAKAKRSSGEIMHMENLIKYIQNHERMQEWVDQYRKKNPVTQIPQGRTSNMELHQNLANQGSNAHEQLEKKVYGPVL